jgi:hypothetical protein
MTPLIVSVKMDLTFESTLSEQQVSKISDAIVAETASGGIPPSYITVTMVLQAGPGSRHLLAVVYETFIIITIPASEARTPEGEASIAAAALVGEDVVAVQASIVSIPVLAEVNGGVVPSGSETYTPTASPTASPSAIPTVSPRYHFRVELLLVLRTSTPDPSIFCSVSFAFQQQAQFNSHGSSHSQPHVAPHDK